MTTVHDAVPEAIPAAGPDEGPRAVPDAGPPAEDDSGPVPPSNARLSDLRDSIDRVDRELVALISRRCRLARTAGDRKREARLPIVDPRQEAAVVRRVARRARAAGLEEEAVRRVFWCLIELSRGVQTGGSTDG